MLDLSEKIVLITGGGGGIGRALAQKMARRGASVIAADINGEAAEETGKLIAREGGRAKGIRLDVTGREDFAAAVNGAAAEFGRLDYLFNNAGIGVGGEARDYAYEDWKKVIDVNLFGVINGVFAAYPLMVKQGHGHIVNVASLAGLLPFAGEISYTTSKYAVVGLSHTLRAEAADLGVKVSVVCPGKIETAIYETSKIINFDREKSLALWPKGITPEKCADVILRGVEKNQATITVTALAAILWRVQRLSPDLTIWLTTRYIRKMREFRTPGA